MANGTAVAQRERAPTPEQRTKHILETRKDEFAKALAGRVDPESFIRVAYTTITKQPKLLEATPASLMMSLLEAASLGLVPNGVMGEAYIVPFNNNVGTKQKPQWETHAQFIPGYRGLIKLVRQSGVIRNITARVVYQGDRFEMEMGLEDRLVHVPDLDGMDDDKNRVTHVYAVAHFTDGTTQFEVMSKKQVERIRQKSKASDSGPWVSDWVAMALKTVIRRLVKYLPISDFDLTRAVEADNRFDSDDISRLANEPAPALPVSRTAALRDRVVAQIGSGSAAIEETEAVVEEAEFTEEVRELAQQVEEADAAGDDDQEPSPKDEAREKLNRQYFAQLKELGWNDADRRAFQKRLAGNALVSATTCGKWSAQDYRSAIAELAKIPGDAEDGEVALADADPFGEE